MLVSGFIQDDMIVGPIMESVFNKNNGSIQDLPENFENQSLGLKNQNRKNQLHFSSHRINRSYSSLDFTEFSRSNFTIRQQISSGNRRRKAIKKRKTAMLASFSCSSGYR